MPGPWPGCGSTLEPRNPRVAGCAPSERPSFRSLTLRHVARGRPSHALRGRPGHLRGGTHDLVDLIEVGVAQRHVRGGETVLDMARLPGADDGDMHGGV